MNMSIVTVFNFILGLIFIFFCFIFIIIYINIKRTNKNKNWTKDNIELQQIYQVTEISDFLKGEHFKQFFSQDKMQSHSIWATLDKQTYLYIYCSFRKLVEKFILNKFEPLSWGWLKCSLSDFKVR